MQYFRRYRRDIDVEPIFSEIQANASAWAEQTGRQRRAAVQAETNSIPIRGLRRSKIRGRRRRDVHETRYTSLAKRFPDTVALLEAFAREMGGSLGRAKFARLPPGAQVLPHVDRGEYYECRDRFHLVVDSTGESVLRAGNEEVGMRAGELWWFDNKALHSARNASDRHRTHLVFDVEPRKREHRASARTQSSRDLRQMLQSAQTCAPDNARQSVAFAVEMYLAIRSDPARWEEILREYDCVERAERQPIEVLTRLLWPTLGEGRRKRREATVAWALAQMDLGRLSVQQVPKAIQEAGGLRQVHEAWRSSKDQMLYGSA